MKFPFFKKDIKARGGEDFGKHPNDFEHRACFHHQIAHVGVGTKYGDGEIVFVEMQSGKTAAFRLYAERTNFSADDTGQRNWKYVFIGYKDEEAEK